MNEFSPISVLHCHEPSIHVLLVQYCMTDKHADCSGRAVNDTQLFMIIKSVGISVVGTTALRLLLHLANLISP